MTLDGSRAVGGQAERCDALITTLAAQLLARPVEPADEISLGSSIGGESLALLAMSQFASDERFLEAAFKRLVTIGCQDFRHPVASTPASLLDGRAGLGLLACHFLDVNEDLPDARSTLERAVRTVRYKLAAEPWLGHFDHVSGLAGVSVLAVNAHVGDKLRQPSERILAGLETHASRTAEGICWTQPYASPEDEENIPGRQRYLVNLGLAHGLPGALLAIDRLGRRWSELRRRAQRLAERGAAFLLAHETACEDESVSSVFPSMTPRGRRWTVPSRLAWCYGDLGAAYSLLRALRGQPEVETARRVVERVVASCLERPLSRTGIRDACVCHGSAGVVALLAAIRAEWSGAPVSELHSRHVDLFLTICEKDLSADGISTIGMGRRRVFATDLLQGASGILLSLLAIRDPSLLRYFSFLGLAGASDADGPDAAAPVSEPFVGVRLCRFSPERTLGAADARGTFPELRIVAAKALEDPEIRRALWIARPELVDRLVRVGKEAWTEDELAVIFRFLHRAAFRPTPFGAFVGVGSACRFVREDEVALPPARLVVDLDYGALACLTERWKTELSRELRCNPSLWRKDAGACWIATSDRNRPDAAKYMYAAMPEALAELLDATVEPLDRMELASRIARAVEISLPLALREVEKLYAAGALVDQTDPILIGENSTERTLRRVTECGLGKEAPALRTLVVRLRDAQTVPTETTLRHLVREVEELAQGAWSAATLHIDTMIEGEARLPVGVAPVLDEAWNALRLLGTRSPSPPALSEFMGRFFHRFGDRALPLAIALDPREGIGYHVRAENPAYADTDKLAARRRHTSSVPTEFPMALVPLRAAEWNLTEEAVRALVEFTGGDHLPMSGGVMLSRVGKTTRGGIVCWEAYPDAVLPGGPACLFGRFSRHSPEMAKQLAMCWQQDVDAGVNVLLGDVVCATDPRSCNVLRRSRLGGAVIEVLGDSGAPYQDRIPVRDLWIRHDGRRLRLWSESRGVEVLPRIAAAHYSPPWAPPVYQLLIDMATAARQPLVAWSWGLLENSEVLPRVRHGNVILSPRQWLLTLPGRSHGDLTEWLRRQVEELSLPRYVSPWIVGDDMTTPWDLHNAISVHDLARSIRSKKVLRIAEYLPSPDQWWMRSEDGTVAVEIAYSPRGAQHTERRGDDHTLLDESQRAWQPFPGARSDASRWLYLRCFGGFDRLEGYLQRAWPHLRRWMACGAATKWFFIRYADPHPEIRLRVECRADSDGNTDSVVQAEMASVLRRIAGDLDRVTVDEYVPETSRYGGAEAMEACEAVFSADSDAALSTLAQNAAIHLGERWIHAAASVDGLLEDMEFSPTLRLAVAQRLLATYGGGVDATTRIRRALSPRWRECREALATCGVGVEKQAGRSAAWEARSDAWAQPLAVLHRLEQDARLGISLSDVLCSIAHMSVNRMLSWEDVLEESVVYEGLRRFYAAWLSQGQPRSGSSRATEDPAR